MEWLGPNFLLTNDFARELYHRHVSHLPVIDYHNHLDPAAIAENRRYANLGALWVTTDPYKHRAMRMNGVAEERISGPTSDRQKFDAWAATCPMTVGNPLYHWSALELKRVFGEERLLTPATAAGIWDRCSAMLGGEEYATVPILRRWNVETLCTSDDLLDSLDVHLRATQTARTFRVVPSLRGDSILNFGNPMQHRPWMARLERTATLEDYQSSIVQRLNAFDQAGCRVADHALDAGFHYSLPTFGEAARIFDAYRAGDELVASDCMRLRSYLLTWLSGEYSRRGWVMLLHVGALRHTSSRLRRLAGPAGGYATIGSPCDMESLCDFLDRAESRGELPRTILFTLNPADNAAFCVTTGSFAEDGIWGKLQFGPAWWYNDHRTGIEEHLRTVAAYGLLSRFVGMTTDSRSILSFSRHEYFRRIVCNWFGERVERGEIPEDPDSLVPIVQAICYGNAKEWFHF